MMFFSLMGIVSPMPRSFREKLEDISDYMEYIVQELIRKI
jgi:cell fate (sporulation/competence/biofilm development) regulator YmcA (YheA/YmcA/DUF963 family)